MYCCILFPFSLPLSQKIIKVTKKILFSRQFALLFLYILLLTHYIKIWVGSRGIGALRRSDSGAECVDVEGWCCFSSATAASHSLLIPLPAPGAFKYIEKKIKSRLRWWMEA
jgi:hypothetical protein